VVGPNVSAGRMQDVSVVVLNRPRHDDLVKQVIYLI
jgi:fructose-1,6-bisphosphatase/sedoheptulose 1,7-bisphosphatase-like protein